MCNKKIIFLIKLLLTHLKNNYLTLEKKNYKSLCYWYDMFLSKKLVFIFILFQFCSIFHLTHGACNLDNRPVPLTSNKYLTIIFCL